MRWLPLLLHVFSVAKLGRITSSSVSHDGDAFDRSDESRFAATPLAPGELIRAQALVDAWARTGSCNATRFAGRCGVIAAVVGRAGAPTVVQTVAGAGLPESGAQFELNTLFEIASNTKVFTAITFHRLVQEGVVTEDATLRSLLPLDQFNVSFLNPQVGTITMREILCHHSGLPRLPSNLHGTPANQFTNYTQRDLFDFLSNLKELPT